MDKIHCFFRKSKYNTLIKYYIKGGFMTYLWICFGLALLVYGGNILVDGSVALAKRMGVSSLLIGLVLVGFGTSTPELTTSLISALKQSNGISVGNVVGSNIANILLVLGAAALIYPISIDVKSFKRDGLVLILSTIALMIVGYLGVITRIAGIIFITGLIVYVIYSYISDKKAHIDDEPIENMPKTNGWLSFAKAIGGIALTIIGAKFLVDNAIILAKEWGVSQSVIGLTIVAVGTSLPELTASVIASIKKENGVAFGNVVGSNIYNALFILGVVAMFMPIDIPTDMSRDMIIMGIVTTILCGIAFWQKQVSRLVGVLFVAAYIVYTYFLFN